MAHPKTQLQTSRSKSIKKKHDYLAVDKLEWGEPCRCLGYLPVHEQEVEKEFIPVLPSSVAVFRSIAFKVWLNRSTRPSVWGW